MIEGSGSEPLTNGPGGPKTSGSATLIFSNIFVMRITVRRGVYKKKYRRKFNLFSFYYYYLEMQCRYVSTARYF